MSSRGPRPGGRFGLILVSVWVLLLGVYCVANFSHCQETHCVVTGGWVPLALLGLAAALMPGEAMSWYHVGATEIAFVVILAVGYSFEWMVAARTGRHRLGEGAKTSPRVAEAACSPARREQILAGAVACFARSGYHWRAPMADVAAAAGVSKGTPYLYFPSKEALFIALHDEPGLRSCRPDERGHQRSPRSGSPFAAAGAPRAVALSVGAHVVAYPDTCRVLMEARTLAAYYPEIAGAVAASDLHSRERLEEIFRSGIAAGEWPPDTDCVLAARLFTATLYGMMAQWHLEPGSFSWDTAAASLAGDPTDPASPMPPPVPRHSDRRPHSLAQDGPKTSGGRK